MDNTTLEKFSRTENTDLLRFERKATISSLSELEIVSAIKNNPLQFREKFAERRVNSIYFDSRDFYRFHQNRNGLSRRSKIRIRWYGGINGRIDSPFLEVKERNYLLGSKRRFAIAPFTFPDPSFAKNIAGLVNTPDFPHDIREYLSYLRPMVLTTYLRRYFLTLDGAYRVTVDKDVQYVRLDPQGMPLGCVKDRNLVIEMKYAVDYEMPNLSFFSKAPLRIGRNSKYVNAVAAFYAV